jgi:malonyl-CoA O-methyltransferase
MKVSTQFSKYASSYGSYSIIQSKVVSKLLNGQDTHDKVVLDIGCGDGAVSKALNFKFKNLTAVDFAKGMIELHPKRDNIETLIGDFNNQDFFSNLPKKSYDMLISSSALQWADNIEGIFKNIAKLDIPYRLSIFTSGTFLTLNQTAGLKPLLRSSEEIKELAKKYLDAEFEVVNYRLEFDSTREMFRYIKKSGVSGSRNLLSYKETKQLMRNYPLNYLEFEVMFITSR